MSLDLLKYATPPPGYTVREDRQWDPFAFSDGSRVQTKDDWVRRREEILAEWHSYMGKWPEVMADQQAETLSVEQLDGYRRERVRFRWTPNATTEAWLLVPDGASNAPAVVTTFYEPETAVGLGPKPNRDYALQLVKRGFVCLSIGTTETTQNKTYSIYYPDIDHAEVEPLSMLAYAAVNAWHVLANRKEVDAERIGIVGHSYGGKWAMFASCLFDRFACAAWSDCGLAFDDSSPDMVNYFEPWYLGWHPRPWRKTWEPVTPDNPAQGAYVKLRAAGRDLYELQALMAPRPFLVSGGSADPVHRWDTLHYSVRVNEFLGYENRVFMTNRPKHEPNPEANEAVYAFFEEFLSLR